jgi:hypothetical protein
MMVSEKSETADCYVQKREEACCVRQSNDGEGQWTRKRTAHQRIMRWPQGYQIIYQLGTAYQKLYQGTHLLIYFGSPLPQACREPTSAFDFAVALFLNTCTTIETKLLIQASL